MYFDSFSDFLAMGKHALYVWMSYGFFVLTMVWVWVDARLNRKENLKNARRVWARKTMGNVSAKAPTSAPEESSE
jgi:heme exporter protein D